MKIKFCCNWCDLISINKRLIEQFKTSDNDLSNIEFVYDNNYDAIIYNNYITEPPKKNSLAFMFYQEPTWSGNHQKIFNNIDNITIFGFDKNNYQTSGNIIELPAHMFYGGRGPTSEGYDFWSYNNLISYDFNKYKPISSIVSNAGYNNEHFVDGCLYKNRINLIENLIINIDYIDVFGWTGNSPNLKGDLQYKKYGLIDYYFSICIENSNENNYVSEKFYDCILTNTIPIYFGCKNIKEIYPENGYILISDINDHIEINKQLDEIYKNYKSLYYSMLPNLIKIKERYFNEYNLLKKINNIGKNSFYDKNTNT